MLSLQRNPKLNSLVQWIRKKSSSNSARNDYLVAEAHCDTNFDLKKGNFSWTINNFSVYEMKKEALKSSLFTAVDDDFKWRLEFFIFKQRESEEEEFIALYFCADSEEELESCGPIKGKIKFSFLKPDSSKDATEEIEFHFKTDADPRTTDGPQMPGNRVLQIAPWSRMKNHVIRDKLTIFCEFSFMKNNNVSNISTSFCSTRRKSNFAQDFEKLLNDEDFSDVTISVKGKDYPAHKNILAARSSTFHAMFKTDMLESSTNRVDIEDIEQYTFEEMLRYIYTGKSKNLGSLAFELLPVAEKYDLKDLKMDCEQALFEKLSRENAVKILILADMHNAAQLRTQTLQFIKFYGTHYVNIKNTELLSASITRPQLMKDVLHVLLEK